MTGKPFIERSMEQADSEAEAVGDWDFANVVNFQLNRLMYQSALGNLIGFYSGIEGLYNIIPDGEADTEFKAEIRKIDEEQRRAAQNLQFNQGFNNGVTETLEKNLEKATSMRYRGILKAIINLAWRKGWLFEKEGKIKE